MSLGRYALWITKLPPGRFLELPQDGKLSFEMDYIDEFAGNQTLHVDLDLPGGAIVTGFCVSRERGEVDRRTSE